ncbi:MAG: sortase [Chloroflexi bacterium]|nr:sortase [Chloroflexota bacterium]
MSSTAPPSGPQLGGPPERPRTINPITAAGLLLILISGAAIATYAILIIPGQVRAQQGPPEAFLLAATRQAEALEATATLSEEPVAGSGPTLPYATIGPTPTFIVGRPSEYITPTVFSEDPAGDFPMPDNWVERYWLSIPTIDLEAPVVAFSPRSREVDGRTVLRLPVPNAFAVSWDRSSAEPGFQGNTIVTGHHNVYGGVFRNLSQLSYGAQVSVWSEYGVFDYTVTAVEYVHEDDQPFSTRLQNAQWLNDTLEDRLTLITCWPLSSSSHRLIVVASR